MSHSAPTSLRPGKAVRQWVYRPAMLGGEPVSFGTQVVVSFRATSRKD